MSNEWKDKVIRGGAIAMGAVAAVACMTVIIGLAVGSPAVLRAGSVISPWLPASALLVSSQ